MWSTHFTFYCIYLTNQIKSIQRQDYLGFDEALQGIVKKNLNGTCIWHKPRTKNVVALDLNCLVNAFALVPSKYLLTLYFDTLKCGDKLKELVLVLFFKFLLVLYLWIYDTFIRHPLFKFVEFESIISLQNLNGSFL